jgi:hypothetical protein
MFAGILRQPRRRIKSWPVAERSLMAVRKPGVAENQKLSTMSGCGAMIRGMRRVFSLTLAGCLTLVGLAGAVHVFANADAEAVGAMRAGGPLMIAPAFLMIVGAIWLWAELTGR